MTTNRIYEINENVFRLETLTNDAAWLLGFIFADGNVTNNTLRISIAEKDIEILEYAKQIMKCNYPISRYKSKTTSVICLSVTHPQIRSDLEQYGIIPRKTYVTTSLPFCIPNGELRQHFLRGFIDGDGHVKASNACQVSITSHSFEVLQLIPLFAPLYCTFEENNRPDGRTWYNARFTGPINCKYLYDYIYPSGSYPALQRKQVALKKIIERVYYHNFFNEYVVKANKSNIYLYGEQVYKYIIANYTQTEIGSLLDLSAVQVKSIVHGLQLSGFLPLDITIDNKMNDIFISWLDGIDNSELIVAYSTNRTFVNDAIMRGEYKLKFPEREFATYQPKNFLRDYGNIIEKETKAGKTAKNISEIIGLTTIQIDNVRQSLRLHNRL